MLALNNKDGQTTLGVLAIDENQRKESTVAAFPLL
jgi:hypothetical protein